MATVKADCPMCGPVRLRARQLTVRICVDDEHHADPPSSTSATTASR